jgi:hypothetical protein
LADLPTAPDALRHAWEAAPLEQQRAILTAPLDRVEVNPAVYRGRFDSNRFEPVWRI